MKAKLFLRLIERGEDFDEVEDVINDYLGMGWKIAGFTTVKDYIAVLFTYDSTEVME